MPTVDDQESKCLLTPSPTAADPSPLTPAPSFPFTGVMSGVASTSDCAVSTVSRDADDEGEVNEGAVEGEEETESAFGQPPSELPSRPGSSVMDDTASKVEMIYSEPTLYEGQIPVKSHAVSDTFLPHILRGFPGFHRRQRPSKDSSSVAQATPKDSTYNSETSIATGVTQAGGGGGRSHKASFSAREIREQHITIQNKYRPQRQRHFTDPVDFEGILRIIGGCSWWQIYVYVLIAMQQIPHAMFNLSVVYMMYAPDHWCQVQGLNDTKAPENVTFLWGIEELRAEQTRFGKIAFPMKATHTEELTHSECTYFDRGADVYIRLRSMPMEKALYWIETHPPPKVAACEYWSYDNKTMATTIVTDWNLVCENNWKRGHAHAFYAAGYLIGCLIGGFASDSFGRKTTIIGFGLLSTMFAFFLPYTQYFPMFLFIRFCSAVCNEAADLAAYVLCMEITGVRYRAMVGSLLQAPWALGYALLALLAYVVRSWKTIQLVAATWHLAAILLICTLPESPRWLMVIDRLQDAEQVIRKACRPPPFPFSLCRRNRGSLPADLELVQHREASKWEKEDRKTSLYKMFQSEMRSRTTIICIVFTATALVYYGLLIALSDQSAPGRVLFSGNFFFNNALAGAIELPTLVACVYLMKFGRRRAQMVTLIAGSICIIIAAVSVHLRAYMLALASLLLGKICVQGAFNILYIFCSELYPTVVRNTAVGLNSMIARTGSAAASYIAILSDSTLPIVPMIIFSSFSFCAGILVKFLPETRDKPLPETFDDAVTDLKPETEDMTCCGMSMSCGGSLFRRRTRTATAEWTALTSDQDNVHNGVEEEPPSKDNPSASISRECTSSPPPIDVSQSITHSKTNSLQLPDEK